MKNLKRYNDFLNEANPDGTISPDEDVRREQFAKDVETKANEFADWVVSTADEIGGGFRGPGIRSEAKDVIKSVLKRKKLL